MRPRTLLVPFCVSVRIFGMVVAPIVLSFSLRTKFVSFHRVLDILGRYHVDAIQVGEIVSARILDTPLK